MRNAVLVSEWSNILCFSDNDSKKIIDSIYMIVSISLLHGRLGWIGISILHRIVKFEWFHEI